METARTIFHALNPSDFPEVLDMYNDKDTFKFIGPLVGLSESEYLRRLQDKYQQHCDKKGYHYVSRDKSDNSLIGILNLNPMQGSDRLFMGYQVRQKLWGQGYGKELAQRMVEFAFDTLKMTEIFALIESEHVVSKTLLLRLGFRLFEVKNDNDVILETYTLRQSVNEVRPSLPTDL